MTKRPGLSTRGVGATKAAAPPSQDQPPQGQVLVIDDNLYLARSIQRYLSDYTVHLAADGVEGLEALRRQRYDFVLCDITMPRVTGVDLFDVVRRELPSVLGRLVFMTGAIDADPIQQFVGACPVPIVEKPFQLSWMSELIQRYLGRGAAGSRSCPPVEPD